MRDRAIIGGVVSDSLLTNAPAQDIMPPFFFQGCLASIDNVPSGVLGYTYFVYTVTTHPAANFSEIQHSFSVRQGELAKMLFAGSSSTGYSRGLRHHMALNEHFIRVCPLQHCAAYLHKLFVASPDWSCLDPEKEH